MLGVNWVQDWLVNIHRYIPLVQVLHLCYVQRGRLLGDTLLQRIIRLCVGRIPVTSDVLRFLILVNAKSDHVVFGVWE